ncbi:uncharacterized protein LOC144884613 [Branchiostoma floridae x Branchiostoma japonicum]
MAASSSLRENMKPKEWYIMGKWTTFLTLELSDQHLRELPDEVFELNDFPALNLNKNKNIQLSEKLIILTNLNLLSLADCNLETIPAAVMKLTQLQTLILSNNKNITLPDEMSSLVNLKALHLDRCNLDSLPPVVLKLSHLHFLDLSHNDQIVLPDELYRLENIKVMRLCVCSMSTVPPAVLKLIQLEELDLSWNSGIYLPDGMSGLTNIRVLELECTSMAIVHPVVWRLTQLERLNLSLNPLRTLPMEVGQLTDVKHLDLSHCQLRTLPPEVGRLTQLEWLNLGSNPLQTLPAEVGQLTNVKNVDLSHCQLRTLPSEVGRLTQLEWLNLGSNPLQTLPAEFGQLSNVKHLDLYNCELRTLPPEVWRLTKLERLDLSHNPLQTLPAEFGQLSNVKHLDLYNCELHTLPPEVGRLTQLELLRLRSNPLQTLPAEIGQLTKIEHLDLSQCELRILPPEVGRLTQLEWLDLSWNPLQTLPAEVGQLTNVKHLKLSDCKLHTLPPEVGRLTQLEELDLSFNPLQTLPAEVRQLTNVNYLYLSKCQLSTLPPKVGRLTQLEKLVLNSNPLQTLPAEVGQLTNVKHLELSDCQLRTLPPEVWRLTQLEWLDLRDNPLQTLPAEIGQLTNAKHLNLSLCQLHILPPEVGRLTQLEWLDLSSNQLQTLPTEVGQLPNLSDLDVKRNPLIKPPPEVCSQGITAIRQYFEELERSEEKVSARLKVVVLGEKMAGKTSLIQTLQRGESSMTEVEDRTHCVEITQWAPDDNIAFEVYDFGGHDVYHLTHQFFMTPDALNVLTVNLETYNCTQQSFDEAVGLWLDTLNTRVPGAVVTIVGSKTDMCSDSEIDEKTRDIQEKFKDHQGTWQRSVKLQIKKLENAEVDKETDQREVTQEFERARQLLTRQLRLTGMLCVSSAKSAGLHLLRRHMMESANNTTYFPTLRKILPRTWVDFEQQLRDLRGEVTKASEPWRSEKGAPKSQNQGDRPKWLTVADCLQQGQLAGLTADILETVLSYLQQVGTILRYTDIPELKDLVFYDPSGLIDVIKELFHHDLKKVFTNKNSYLVGFSNTELKKVREKLSRKGFLPRDVAIALLGPHATPVGNVDVITNLMEHFGLCYTERSDEQGGETSTTTGYYIPWYIQEKRAETINRDVAKEEGTEFNVTCEIIHFCPRGLFERLSVVVNKLITSRQNWEYVIMAVRESLPVIVYRETKEEHVNIVVKLTVPAQSVQGTQKIWDIIGPLKDKLSTLLKEWPGLLYHLVYSTFTRQGEQEEDQQTSTGSFIIPTFEVGPEGCTVQHGGVTLEFHQGCVNETRFISFEVEAVPVNDDIRTNFTAMSAVLTVEQDFPQRFLRPVTVRLPWVWTQHGEKHEATGKTTRIVILHYSRENGWTEFATDTEEGAEEITFETDQFQSYVVARVKSVCHGIIAQLWEAIWIGYCEDKVYLIVMPYKVFLPDRFVHILCVHKLADATKFFSIGYVSLNHQIKHQISMTNRERIRAYLSTNYDIQIEPRDLPPDGMIFEFPPADGNRYSFAVEKRTEVTEKDIYHGRISFDRLDLWGNVRDVRGGKIEKLPILLHSHRESQGATADTFVLEDEDAVLRQRPPSQHQQQLRSDPTASSPLRQQRHMPRRPVIVAIATAALAIIAYQFLFAGSINNLTRIPGGGEDAPWKDTSKILIWLPLTVVAAIFGIWFFVFRKGVPIVLLINDEYGTSKGGISTINCQLGQILTKARAVVYATALKVPKQDKEAADRDGVKLIQPVQLDEDSVPTLDWLTKYHSVHYPDLPQDVSCIIGHADITDTAARNIWEQRYPQADLMTYNHVIPEDTEFFKGGQKAMKARKKEKNILHNSNNAKVTFSVGRRIFDHYKTKYRGEKKPQSHHIFLPKPSHMFLAIDVNPVDKDSEKVVLSIGRVRKVEKLKGHDLIAQSMRKVVRIIKNVRWAVRGISEDDWETSLKILEDNLKSGDLNPTLLPYGTQEDIRDDMMTAHLVLMPSRSEPFGLVGLEAIAAGIPVLISDKTGLAGMILDLIKQGKLSAEHRHVIVETSVNDFDRAGDAKRWTGRIVDILKHSDSEFEKAARLKRELVESRYWEESHRTFLQACGIPAAAADL